MLRSFDYIITGAGSAGCVVANRLSEESGNSVLVVEAGGQDRHPLLAMPLACAQVFYRPDLNWGFQTEPEPFADNRILNRAAGKLLGGGSSINGMMYTRGHRRDYDQWAQMGCTGWSHADVLPYFKRAESNWRGASDVHGGEGPLTVSRHVRDVLFEKVAVTARKLGYPVVEDFERDGADGFGVPDFTTHAGRRGSTARRYLHPAASRANLTIECNAQVLRILFDGRRAVGVEYAKNGQVHRATADREVILSGGAYNSPRLLMLSGIGRADDLRAHGIDIVQDLPGVGYNLQEHPGAEISFRSKEPMPIDSQVRLDRLMFSVMRWRLTGTGSISALPFTAMAFCRTRPELERPDIELLFTPGFNSRIWFPGWRKPNARTLAISTFLMRPESRGWVKLRSADPRDPPRILLNLLAEPEDRATLLKGLRMVREFMATEPAASQVTEELVPGAGVASDEALSAHIRRVIRTMQHPTSSCAMGTGVEAVVDPQLRVHGTERLRVIDASIMPIIIGGHTNAPSIMIGEKGADLVLGRTLPTEALPKAA